MMIAPLQDRHVQMLQEAWQAFDGSKGIRQMEELSAKVSQNRVFRLTFEDQSTLIAKCSSYGEYEQFIDDHIRIRQWSEALAGSQFQGFLADTLVKENQIFSHFGNPEWVIFYEEKPIASSLPKILTMKQVGFFAREIGKFHQQSLPLSQKMAPLQKSAMTDIRDLYVSLDLKATPYPLLDSERKYLMEQCETFLKEMDRLGYHHRTRIPLLIDWNIGNFSIKGEEEQFQFESRWDYDWFRMEPAMFDFYFCSRIVSHEGDRADFSYWPHGFFEPRFKHFLTHYQLENPLFGEDIFFLKEVYRFFILNYVIKDGPKFFRPQYFQRLKQESIHLYLPEIDSFDFYHLYQDLKRVLK